MARVLTFSRTFPAHHPRKGEPTYFVEKILKSLMDVPDIELDHSVYSEYWCELANEGLGIITTGLSDVSPKYHTIRAGKRWKVGDKFSPRVWSGRPYKSKQIIIAPDIEVKKVWDFEIEVDGDYICVLINNRAFYEENSKMVTHTEALETLAKNDGLTVPDLKDWFKWGKPFSGQIICWNENINY